MTGICTTLKDTSESSLILLLPLEETTGSQHSADPNHADALTSDFLFLECEILISVLHELPNLWYLVKAVIVG